MIAFEVVFLMSMDQRTHWNNIYDQVPDAFLGWYEENPQYGLELILKYSRPGEKIMLAGGGTTRLLPLLLNKTDRELVFADISSKAIDLSRSMVDDEERISWLCCDLSKEVSALDHAQIDLWFDRALLHFFHTEEEITTYRNNILRASSKGSRVILGVFQQGTAEVCSGLPTKNYDLDLMDEFLGPQFRRLDGFNLSYTMPGGDERMYIWGIYELAY